MFIVPIITRFGGTENSSPLCGSFSVRPRLSFSMRVMSSLKTFGMLPRLISSMRRTKRCAGAAAAAAHKVLNMLSVRVSSSRPLAAALGSEALDEVLVRVRRVERDPSQAAAVRPDTQTDVRVACERKSSKMR